MNEERPILENVTHNITLNIAVVQALSNSARVKIEYELNNERENEIWSFRLLLLVKTNSQSRKEKKKLITGI